MNEPEVLRVTSRLEIPLDELEWRFSASGGPGGQHANTANTKVEVRFDIAASPSLEDYQRERLTERLGSLVSVVASDSRSQVRNRAIALERLAHRLREAMIPPAARVATKVPRSAQRARVDDKRQRAGVKVARQRPKHGDD